MPFFSSHPSSYRDPSGFVFYHDGQLYRQVNRVFRDDFDQFINGGLYHHLLEKNMIVDHQVVDQNLTGSNEWYQTLKPDLLPFISYPYEWCFNMLKDAALATLQAAKEAMSFGMMLKDASAYNLQWHKGKMVFIDSLSFEKYDEQKPWIAYRQFCEHFFAPLALMHYLQEPLQTMLFAYPEGIPLSLARKMLPFKSKWNLHTSLHLHLHGKGAKAYSKGQSAQPFSLQKMKNLLRSLEEGIAGFSFSEPSGVWSQYYEEAHQREDYLSKKKEIIARWLDQVGPAKVLDAGANEGEFSELAARHAQLVLSADLDHYSINRLYEKIKKEGRSSIHPLIIELSNPSPAIGVNNEERSSFLNRASVDLVMALALIHHLSIGKNIPFEMSADMFQRLGSFLIIEFVPKEDEKVKLMLQQKKDVYLNYNEENFRRAFEKYFSIIGSEAIGVSGRTVYLMKKND